MQLTGIEELRTPNGMALMRGYDSNGWRWSFHPAHQDNPAEWYASTTGILDIFTPRELKEWWQNSTPEEIKKKSGAALKRGTDMHRAIAEGKTPKSVKDRLVVEHSEISVYSPTYGVAGTIDHVGTLDDIPFILDYKSGRSYGIKTGYQLAAYRNLWHELMGEWRGMAGVHIPPGGEPQRLFTYQYFDFCWLAFLCSFQLWKSMYFRRLEKMGWRWLKDEVVAVSSPSISVESSRP